jgi:exonuclease-1
MQLMIVFDGAPLPMKSGTEADRAKSRNEALAKALELEARGEKALAQSFFVRAVDVTPQMAFELSEHLRVAGVNVIVAPYEADAQLGYLSRHNLVDIVVSEDSDLIVYGCKRILYKLDFKTERGKELYVDDIFSSGAFSRLSRETFLVTAVLAGCDYLPSLQSIGMKTALALGAKAEAIMSSNTSTDQDICSDWFLDKLVMLIRLSGVDDSDINDDFKTQFQNAILTFRHQTVFCPLERKLLALTPVEKSVPFLGEIYDPETACLVADCLAHPESKALFVKPSIETENNHETDNKKPSYRPAKKARKEEVKIPEKTGFKLVYFWNKKSGEIADPESKIIELIDDSEVNVHQPVSRNIKPIECVVEPVLDLSSLDRLALQPKPSPTQLSLDTLDSLRFNSR